jgi:hypothetical protein
VLGSPQTKTQNPPEFIPQTVFYDRLVNAQESDADYLCLCALALQA